MDFTLRGGSLASQRARNGRTDARYEGRRVLDASVGVQKPRASSDSEAGVRLLKVEVVESRAFARDKKEEALSITAEDVCAQNTPRQKSGLTD